MSQTAESVQFSDHSSLRKFFRGVVLPVEKIKRLCRNVLQSDKVNSILDFGAGTFFWTDWFVDEFRLQVYAVDVYYQNMSIEKQNVECYTSLNDCLNHHQDISTFFACDVLHHLTESESHDFIKKATDTAKVVIIKDIDANHAFGNFMNRMHDKIINKEDVRSVYPNKIRQVLERSGYEVDYYYIPKLWYPHFLLIGVKK